MPGCPLVSAQCSLGPAAVFSLGPLGNSGQAWPRPTPLGCSPTVSPAGRRTHNFSKPKALRAHLVSAAHKMFTHPWSGSRMLRFSNVVQGYCGVFHSQKESWPMGGANMGINVNFRCYLPREYATSIISLYWHIIQYTHTFYCSPNSCVQPIDSNYSHIN